MKPIFRLPAVVLIFLSVLVSCTNDKYGKKIKVEGTKGEIFYTEGITETEARKVGDALKEEYLSKAKGASIQVSKENSEYLVRFIYDQDYYDKHETLESVFKHFGVKLSKEAFNGEKVNIALADEHFKDFKRLPYEEAESPIDKGLAPAAPPAGPMTTESETFDHDTAGGVTFFWKGISDKESKRIADYIVENGAFAGGTAQIYISKEGDRYLLQFPVMADYRNDAATIAEVERVSKQIKDNVFAGNPYTFQMTDENLKAVKSFDY